MQITIDKKIILQRLTRCGWQCKENAIQDGYLLTLQKYRGQQIIFFERNCRI